MSLSTKIRQYAKMYYEGNPQISDAAFDQMVEDLRKQNPNDPILERVGWGYEIKDSLDAKPHKYEVAKFESKVKQSNLIQVENPRVSVKLDGGSIIAYYIDGKLDYAITRGDGWNGLDITKRFSEIAPVALNDFSFTGMVRGEIVMKTKTFEDKYKGKYESSRNLAIGIIKRKEVDLTSLDDVNFVAYTVRGISKISPVDTKDNVKIWLDFNKFEQVDFLDIDDWSDENLKQVIKSYKEYPIDGIVITSNRYQKLEDGTYVPEREVAYKTQADTVEVEVTDVTWNLTRTGLLYPRVWFNPVNLSGANLQKASAFNADYVKLEGIGKGAIIEVQRSGEVIPDVVRVVEKACRVELPTHCPECGAELEWQGVHLICNNPNCSGKGRSNVVHWIHTLAPIKGLGDTLINDLLDHFDINSVPELYAKVDFDRLHEIPNTGYATVNLFKEMMSWLNSSTDFTQFMVACNLKSVGWKAAESLADYKKLIIDEEINDDWSQKIESIKGVNITGRNSIRSNIDTIREYAKLVNIFEPKPQAKVEVDKNKVVTITGSLSVTRNQFLEEIAQYGWIEGTIAKAKYLITDNPNSGSSKCKKAKELGKEIISEEEFRKIMSN